MGTFSFAWAAASFVTGILAGAVINIVRHKHDLDEFRQ